MKIKTFIILIYTLAGLLIAALSAFMTFIIIGTAIGTKMLIQIAFAIILVLPIIIVISYFLGKYLSLKFDFIKKRLSLIKDENFKENMDKNIIIEINEINQNMNFVSNRLNTLISDLKQKNQNLSNLLVSMAHDVKTPLTIINGSIEEIEDGLIKKEDLANVLRDMKQEVNFLNELTIDMLDFISSMQNHKTKEIINLKSFIDAEVFTLLQNKEGVEYINDVSNDIEIVFNKMDLKKVFLNILNNAIKFTHKGYIKIKIINETIVFENNGEKIEEEYKEKIFEPFFTISKSKNRKTTGFGLGLSIVNNLSKSNSYKCYLKSSSADKTIFYLQKENK